MAWYAELVRKRWYCICGIDMIHEYKKKLYDDWYNSLTEEEKERLAEIKKQKQEKADQELKMIMLQLSAMKTLLSGLPNTYRDL